MAESSGEVEAPFPTWHDGGTVWRSEHLSAAQLYQKQTDIGQNEIDSSHAETNA